MLSLGIRRLQVRTLHQSSVRCLFKGTGASTATKGAGTTVIVPTQEQENSYKTHPILKRVPKFLRPYTTSFINAPFSHVVSFVVLHEITAIVPLVGIWWYLHKYQVHLPIDLPSWAIDKGTKVIDSSLKKFDFTSFTLNDKFTFVTEGAYAFVIVKLLLPFRVAFSLVFMPVFARWFVIPFTKMFKREKKVEVEVKPVTVKEVKQPRL